MELNDNLPLQGRGLAARSVAKHSCRAQHAAPLRLMLVVRRRACDTLRENCFCGACDARSRLPL